MVVYISLSCVRVSLKPLFVVKTLGSCAAFFPLGKAYRSTYRQLAGHLTGSLTGTLTGHELVVKHLW